MFIIFFVMVVSVFVFTFIIVMMFVLVVMNAGSAFISFAELRVVSQNLHKGKDAFR